MLAVTRALLSDEEWALLCSRLVLDMSFRQLAVETGRTEGSLRIAIMRIRRKAAITEIQPLSQRLCAKNDGVAVRALACAVWKYMRPWMRWYDGSNTDHPLERLTKSPTPLVLSSGLQRYVSLNRAQREFPYEDYPHIRLYSRSESEQLWRHANVVNGIYAENDSKRPSITPTAGGLVPRAAPGGP
jgi:hypothetical protein